MRPVRIRVGSGARDTETALLENLDERFAAGGRAPQPLLVIVPSRSLRHHLLATLARRHGAVLGLSCQTLHSLARTVLERGGRPVPQGGDLLFELLARRFARRERQLAEPLGGLHDGFAAVAATVRDLLDAGFDPAHSEALDETLDTEGRQAATREATERARALVRVAHRTAQALHELGSGGPSGILQHALDLLRDEARNDEAEKSGHHAALPAGEIFIHGFADATGLATDLLQTVLEHRGGTVYLDHPPDPASGGAAAAGDNALLFGRRFRERLQALAPPEEARRPLPAPRIDAFRALGESAEVRAAAERIVKLLDGGAAAETIAIVARDLRPYRTPIRIHLDRLGIPFAADAQAGPPHPSTRRIEALLELVERKVEITLESWIDILTELFDRTTLSDLRLAMAAGGWRRLRDLLTTRRWVTASRLRLPVFERLGNGDDGSTHAERRRLDPDALERLREIADATEARLREWPDEAPVDDHLEVLRSLLVQTFGWMSGDPILQRVLQAIERIRLAAGNPSADRIATDGYPPLSVTREEFRLLLRRALDGDDRFGDSCLAGTPLGGRGAGVQILNAVEARGRTFSHLFVLGMNRGRFPRTVREDPILPDELRQVLGREGHGVLPDLDTKRSGHYEERFLFAQLLSASPHVTLSWLEVADDDSRKSLSPLVERLRWSPDGQDPTVPIATQSGTTDPDPIPLARPILALDPSAEDSPVVPAGLDPGWRPRTAYEAAIVAGTIDRQRLATLLPLALEEAWKEVSPNGLAPRSVATARLAALSEWDPPPGLGARRPLAPGPFLGFIGPPPDARDPRRARKLFVTTLEGLARCPWQSFLTGILRLGPLPDPLSGPPRLEASHVGTLVHRILQSLVEEEARDASGHTLEEFATGAVGRGTALVWPDADELAGHLRREAERLLFGEGVDYPGMVQVLSSTAHRHLDVARLLDARESMIPQAVEAEIYGAVALEVSEAPNRRLHFKADRAERLDDSLRLTDFKTGRPPGASKTVAAKRKALLAQLATGQLLQAASYARAAADALTDRGPGGDGQGAGGRYLYLRPDLELEKLEYPVAADDAQLFEIFDAVTRTLLAQWEAGVLFPRLERHGTEEEPSACDYCDVKEACARGDSGVRRRLRQWIAEREDTESPAPESDIDQLLVAAWRLSAKWVAP